MKSTFLLSILLCLAVGTYGAGPGQESKVPAPSGAVVSLKLPASAIIGDAIGGEFVVRNAGKAPFEINTGGDYRGAPASLRLKVKVSDAQGNVLPDLTKNAPCFGGMVGNTLLNPGDSKSMDCPLEAYVAIRKPGVYIVSAWHDLGWQIDEANPRPLATTKIEFKLPKPENAAARVHTLCAQELEKSGRELQHLSAPVFLTPLIAEGRAGRAHACLGINGIATPEANDALLEFANSDVPEMAGAAAAALLGRLPSLADPKAAAIRSFFDQTPREEIFSSWTPAHDPRLLAVAEKLLKAALPKPVPPGSFSGSGIFHSPDEDLVSLGAALIQARGGASQATAVIEALQRSMSGPVEPRRGPKANVLDAPAPIQALIYAIDALRDRGWRPVGPAGGTALLLAGFRQLADPNIPRSESSVWEDSVSSFLDANPPVFRENAVRAIPRPAGPEWEKRLRVALEDKDWGVVLAACNVAGDSKLPGLIRPLAQVIETVHQNFVQEAASEAAVKLGPNLDVWQAWAEVVVDEERSTDAVTHLILGTIDLPPSGGSGGGNNLSRDQRFQLREAWRRFLAQNHERLASGKRVPRDDASVSAVVAALSPGRAASVLIHLKNGTEWPPQTK